jgi:hypothetical protein
MRARDGEAVLYAHGGITRAASGYRLEVDVEALSNPEEDNGWPVLVTTVCSEACTDADILQAYQDPNTTVEPGFRWLKNPAAISPV